MTEVPLAKLPVVVAAHSVDQVVILVICILADDDSVIVAWTHTYNFDIVFDVW